MSSSLHPDEIGHPRRRRALKLVLLAMVTLLGLRLYQLQLLYHTELGKKSEDNIVRSIIKEPIRGYIIDRNGILVADVGPSFSVTVTPAEFDMQNLPLLSSLLGIDNASLADRITKGRAYSRFAATRVERDIDFHKLSALEENLYRLPGVNFSFESKRIYPSRARASHLLGYCREITDAQLSSMADDFYRQGDLIGSAGLEAKYEQKLRGEKGYELLSVNARGQVIGSFEDGKNDRDPREGLDLLLSVDIGLQAFAESLMTNHRGALVALDPSDGGILAMVSKPDYDPSVFSGLMATEDWDELNADTTHPLFNRATMTRYPPGSTFKMVLAAAALQNHVLDTNFRITCRGSFTLGNRTYKDMHSHGSVNIIEAIQRSCNVFFFQLMLKVDLEPWYASAKKFGFGSRTQVDLMEENEGLIPNTEYFDRVFGKGRWTRGYLVSLAIGQGEVGVSPLQMARYAAALGTSGTLVQPYLVRAIRNRRTNALKVTEPVRETMDFRDDVWQIIREGMRRVVNEPGGTGRASRVPGVVVAGKTGTAENPHGEDHAWYIGFAPFENPKIAIAVMLENEGQGGAKAAPIAGLVMERYLYGEIVRYKYHPSPKPATKDSVVVATHVTAE
jgi:penicillin-binding protein 2